MNQYLTSNDIETIRIAIADTLSTPRTYNHSLRSYQKQLDVILGRIRDIQTHNEKLLTEWTDEKKFAEEWNIEIPDYPILKNINFSKEEIEIIKEVFQETKKEYPSDDLLSTYLGESVETLDFTITKLDLELKNYE